MLFFCNNLLKINEINEINKINKINKANKINKTVVRKLLKAEKQS
jgi:hypothetical protein